MHPCKGAPLPTVAARAYRRGLERAIEEIRERSNALHCAEGDIDAVVVIQDVIDELDVTHTSGASSSECDVERSNKEMREALLAVERWFQNDARLDVDAARRTPYHLVRAALNKPVFEIAASECDVAELDRTDDPEGAGSGPRRSRGGR